MQWRRFMFYNAVGSVAWVAVWVSAGYLAGDHIAAIYKDTTRYSIYVLIAVVVVLAAYVAWRIVRRRRESEPAGHAK
jgi:membrane protein DedA with SNARE-associated domain